MTIHSKAEFKRVAEKTLILKCSIGSEIHGVSSGASDRDEMGVCIEPPEYVVGLQPFEQYQYRTQPDHVRSGPGDLDLTVYSLRKWVRLAAAGNPTILMLLFVPKGEHMLFRNPFGKDLQESAELFVTKQIAAKFIGYLDSQRDKMLGLRAQRTNRPELIKVHGFDTKFAYHACRLGIQGVELLRTGTVTLPMAEDERTWLTELRQGKHTLQDALDVIAMYRSLLVELGNKADLPARPDYPLISRRLCGWYGRHWAWMDRYREA